MVERPRIRSFASKWEKVKKPVSWQVSVSWPKERKRRRSGRGMYIDIYIYIFFLTRVESLRAACTVFPCVFHGFLIVQTKPQIAYFLSGYFVFQHPPRGWNEHHRPWEYHADKHRARNCDTSARVRLRLTPDILSREERMRRV